MQEMAPDLYAIFISSARKMMQGRTLVSSRDWRLCLAPKDTEVGDSICVILGCPTPLILRREDSSHCSVVGQCYLDGYMYGEALFGPLPDQCKAVSKYLAQYEAWYDAYLDCESGETQCSHLRAGPLPAGWHIESHSEEDAGHLYVSDSTGEETWSNPRASPRHWKLGVSRLKSFDSYELQILLR